TCLARCLRARGPRRLSVRRGLKLPKLPKLLGWTVLISAAIAYPLFAATPADQLDQAVQQFQKGDYQQARRTLLDLDTGKLTDEQSERRSELLEEVSAAINQSNRARQNLDDGDKAFDAHDDAAAEKLYNAVIDNSYASPAQKQRA